MCDEVVDDSLGALKFIHHSFNASKVIEKLLIALFADDILYFNEDFGNAIFSCNEMVLLMQILIILTLVLLIIINMILQLLMISDFWFCISNLINIFKKS